MVGRGWSRGAVVGRCGRGAGRSRAAQSPSRPLRAERAPHNWDSGLIAQFARPGLGRSQEENPPAAIPMGLCFPCPTEAAPPSPDLVSKTASQRPRVRPPAPRAPVPGGARRRPRAAAPGLAVGSGGTGRGARRRGPWWRRWWPCSEGP